VLVKVAPAIEQFQHFYEQSSPFS